MDILVIGATGGSGRAVCNELLQRGHRVTALARQASRLATRPGLTAVDGDATDTDLLDRVMPSHDVVVVTLGISEPALSVRLRGARSTTGDVRSRGTAAVVAAARRAGVRRVIVQSSYGVGETQRLLGMIDRLFLALLIGPQIADTAVQEAVLRSSGLNWTIVQPVYLSDDDAVDHFVSTDGHRRGRTVSRHGVACVHADLVEQGTMIGRTVSVSG